MSDLYDIVKNHIETQYLTADLTQSTEFLDENGKSMSVSVVLDHIRRCTKIGREIACKIACSALKTNKV